MDYGTSETMDALTTKLKAAGIERDYLDNATIARFLRVDYGNIDKTVESLKEFVEFRDTKTPWWPKTHCPLEKIQKSIDSGKAYVRGNTKAGEPILWMRIKHHVGKATGKENELFFTFQVDELVARLDKSEDNPELEIVANASTFVLVIDFEGFGTGNFDLDIAKSILTTLKRCYPGRTSKIIVVRTNMLFRVFWKAFSLFMDERAQRKIHIAGPNYLSELKEYVDLSQIPEDLGGLSSYKYNPADVLSYVSVRKVISDQ